MAGLGVGGIGAEIEANRVPNGRRRHVDCDGEGVAIKTLASTAHIGGAAIVGNAATRGWECRVRGGAAALSCTATSFRTISAIDEWQRPQSAHLLGSDAVDLVTLDTAATNEVAVRAEVAGNERPRSCSGAPVSFERSVKSSLR